MNRPSRESVYAALFSVLQTLPGVTTCSRRLVNVQGLEPERFPAAYQMQDEQQTYYKGTTPTHNVWKASWILYAYQSDETQPISPLLNSMVDAVAILLTPDPGQPAVTLGGLVTHVGIDGTVQVFEGVLGDRAVAVVPISIVLPGF